jgi:hypothetical protein
MDSSNVPQCIERRQKYRYPLTLELTWKLPGNTALGGLGQTVNISSSGLLFHNRGILYEKHLGRRIELRLTWPFLLNGSTPLQLVAWGKISRLDEKYCAVRLEHTEFRTVNPNARRATA